MKNVKLQMHQRSESGFNSKFFKNEISSIDTSFKVNQKHMLASFGQDELNGLLDRRGSALVQNSKEENKNPLMKSLQHQEKVNFFLDDSQNKSVKKGG